MIVKRLFVDDPALIQADVPGTQFIAGRKSAIKPKTAFENIGMKVLVQINKELADVAPHFLTNGGKALQPVDLLPVRDEQFVNPCQGGALMVCLLKYLL